MPSLRRIGTLVAAMVALVSIPSLAPAQELTRHDSAEFTVQARTSERRCGISAESVDFGPVPYGEVVMRNAVIHVACPEGAAFQVRALADTFAAYRPPEHSGTRGLIAYASTRAAPEDYMLFELLTPRGQIWVPDVVVQGTGSETLTAPIRLDTNTFLVIGGALFPGEPPLVGGIRYAGYVVLELTF